MSHTELDKIEKTESQPTSWPLFKCQNPSIFDEKSGPPAWKQFPTWYQISDNNHAIPPDVERMLAKQMNATTISIPSRLQ